MRATDAYGELLRMGRPIVTTKEAATRWRVEQRTAGRRLGTMENAGFVRRLRRGLWTLESDVDPLVVPPYLTAPFPAYVSFWSALAHHDVIEQLPREISVASLDRARRIVTSIGTYAIHHLAPEVFRGYEGSQERGYMAVPEKALFDLVYVRAASGRRAYFPELSLPSDFNAARIGEWTAQIASARLRTMVTRRLAEVLR